MRRTLSCALVAIAVTLSSAVYTAPSFAAETPVVAPSGFYHRFHREYKLSQKFDEKFATGKLKASRRANDRLIAYEFKLNEELEAQGLEPVWYENFCEQGFLAKNGEVLTLSCPPGVG